MVSVWFVPMQRFGIDITTMFQTFHFSVMIASQVKMMKARRRKRADSSWNTSWFRNHYMYHGYRAMRGFPFICFPWRADVTIQELALAFIIGGAARRKPANERRHADLLMNSPNCVRRVWPPNAWTKTILFRPSYLALEIEPSWPAVSTLYG